MLNSTTSHRILGDWTHQLLFVEADEEDREVMGGLFTPPWGTCQCHSCGIDTLEEQLQRQQPELVVINTLSPGMDVPATVQSVRKYNNDSYCIFITGHLNQTQRLDIFEQGADDIVEKPYDPIQVHYKVIAELKNIGLRRQLTKERDEASSTAHTVLNSYAETGIIIDFFKALVSTRDYDGAGIALLRAADKFGLRSTLQIHGVDGLLNFRCENHSPEAEIMTRCFKTNHQIEANGRLTITRSSVCLLVKNLPAHDEQLYGRLKDHLYTMAIAADDHVASLHQESQVQEERRLQVEALVANTRNNLHEIANQFERFDSHFEAKIFDFKNNMESILWGLGLEPDQETTLLNSIDEFHQEILANKELQNIIASAFTQVINDIDRCQ